MKIGGQPSHIFLGFRKAFCMPVRKLIFALAAATPIAQPGSAQTPIPEWRLSAPKFVIDGTTASLHHVRGAAILSDGSIIIADAGNNRLLLYSVDGAQITWPRRCGRMSRGYSSGGMSCVVTRWFSRQTPCSRARRSRTRYTGGVRPHLDCMSNAPRPQCS